MHVCELKHFQRLSGGTTGILLNGCVKVVYIVIISNNCWLIRENFFNVILRRQQLIRTMSTKGKFLGAEKFRIKSVSYCILDH